MKYVKYALLALAGAAVGWASYQSARTLIQKRQANAIPDTKEDAVYTSGSATWRAVNSD